jgi:ferredoxin
MGLIFIGLFLKEAKKMGFFGWSGLVIGLIVIFMVLQNRSKSKQASEDIDEINNSLYEMRTSLKSQRAEWNHKTARLRTEILKIKGEIPADRSPFYITKDCIACGTCKPECPVDAISEGPVFEIDPGLCIACGKCAKVCPVNACQVMQ